MLKSFLGSTLDRIPFCVTLSMYLYICTYVCIRIYVCICMYVCAWMKFIQINSCTLLTHQVELDSQLGKTVVVTKTTPSYQGPG